MPEAPFLRRTARAVDRRLPWDLRRTARELNQRRTGRAAPLVTLVLAPEADDLPFFPDSLEALRGQTHRFLEVLVVTGPGAEGAADVVRTHAPLDWRVRLVPDDGPADARLDRAAARARGRYVGFVGARDVVPPHGIATLVESLERTGSDFAVGRAVAHGRAPHESPLGITHQLVADSASIDRLPLAVTDLLLGNKLFRTSFWRRSQLAFPTEVRDAARGLVLAAFAAAGAFDFVPVVTYQVKHRAGRVAFGTVSDAMSELDDWLADEAVLEEQLGGLELAAVRDAWSYVVCDQLALPFLDDVHRADDRQWQALHGFLADVHGRITPRAWRRVRAESRVKVMLAVLDRREELEELLARRWFEGGNHPTELVGGELRAVLPFYRAGLPGLDDDCFTMAEEETPLVVVLRGLAWSATGSLELDLYAYVDFLDQGDEVADVTVELVEAGAGRRVPLTVTPYVDSGVNMAAARRYQDYARSALRAELDPAALDVAGGSGGSGTGPLASWSLQVSLRSRGVERSGPVTRVDRRGSAGQLGSPALSARSVAGRRLHLRHDPRAGLVVDVLAPAAALLEQVEGSRRSLSGVLRQPAGGQARALVATRTDGRRVRSPLVDRPDGSQSFTLDLGGAGHGGSWALSVDAGRGAGGEVALAGASDPLHPGLLEPGGRLVVVATGSGAVEVQEADLSVVLDDLEVGETAVRVTGRWLGTVPEGWEVALEGPGAEVVGTVTLTGRRFTADLPLTWDPWGRTGVPLPLDLYALRVRPGAGAGSGEVRLLLAASYQRRLLASVRLEAFRVLPVCQDRAPALRLQLPLQDDERGPFHQRRLQQWTAETDEPLDPTSVYLQSYTGRTATDSQRAIHDELRRTRPDLTVHWGVADLATEVPEGGVPVLMRTAEWYRVLATATYLSNNIDFERWWHKRPGQRQLQTFHGYPAKAMGLRMWLAKRYPPRRLEAELDRTSRGWDLILTPSPEMDQYYRSEYRYDGPIESSGYPRDDVLVSPEADGIRERTRALLGIAPGQTAVLYAPTWRDDLATSWRSAEMVHHLDLETATKRLGSEYVFLMRGHRFHSARLRGGGSARLLDVTDYPEINDLILASDAAVLDYSSLRFDFALTRRPMLFLVPDLGAYSGDVRGFLYPYEESAPGPLCSDAGEVIELLRDLDGVHARYAEEYQRFHERFNYLQDGQAAARVVRRFFGPAPDAASSDDPA